MGALLLGYALGGHTGVGATRTAAIPRSNLLLEYPSSWRRSAHQAPIAGAGLEHPLELVPENASAAEAGLLAGVARAHDGQPLPAGVLRILGGIPHGEAVWLASSPAYRYQRLLPSHHRLILTAYAIPEGSGGYVVALCFAPRGSSSTIRTDCEQIVESSEDLGPSQRFGSLAPEPSFARRLGALLQRFAITQRADRLAITGAPRSDVLARTARNLADAAAAAAQQLDAIAPVPASAGSNAALASAFDGLRAGYATLAASAEGAAEARLAQARAEVTRAEAKLREAIARFRLIGYELR